MTVIAVTVDPPREGLAYPELPETSPLSAAEAADLYRATVADTLRAIEASGGDLLVNYRPEDLLPEGVRGEDGDAEAEVRALAAAALDEPGEARFEVQVGSTYAARVGNTVTHLLEREDADTVAVVDGTTPTLARTHVDSAAMKLRRRDVILGPADRGRVYFAGFAAPIDFADAYTPPELETLTHRAVDAGLDVDFLEREPAIETGDDLVTLVSLISARRTAGRHVPPDTAALIEEWGLQVVVEGGQRRLVRGSTDRS